MDQSLLLPREKYFEAARARGQFPSFEIEKHNQILFYFGANHSRDPQNGQYSELKKYWDEFLRKTNGKNSIVLIEGRNA